MCRLQMHFKVWGNTQKYNFNNLCYLPIPQNTDRRIITVQNPTFLPAGISMICFHPNFSWINSILELYMIIFRHNSQMAIHFVFQKWRILQKRISHFEKKIIITKRKQLLYFNTQERCLFKSVVRLQEIKIEN